MVIFFLAACHQTSPNKTFDSTEDIEMNDSGISGDTAIMTTSETTWTFESDTVTVHHQEYQGLREYRIVSTHPQRDGASNERTYREEQGDPILRSGNLLTDALFALAVTEARDNAVSQIQDGAFQGVEDCECYRTGALWNWVWTRDIAYASELSLAWLDTDRAKNSLLFKLSEPKGGSGLHIVQDTGTGGSWPVSTDRVTWARGAMAVLKHTDDPYFRQSVIEAFQNTAALDREFVFDSSDGLYFGETSFLDWREQTYPSWTEGDTVHIGMTKSLSTNLNHLFMLRSLETLTGEEHGASDLATAIDEHFWQGSYYSSYILSPLNPMPVYQQDLLATSLAILDLGTHPEALNQYPHTAVGAPVIHPQQQLTPIYHNRAIWPFVSSYALLAARKADNAAVFTAQLDSLVRAAALNISHMENLEFQEGLNWKEDGDYSGPVVNSKAQLWSVAGFLGAVVHGVFGLERIDGQWQSDPVIPNQWFESNAVLTIDGIDFSIGDRRLSEGTIEMLDESSWTNVYAARTPEVSLSSQGNNTSILATSTEDVTFSVFKDGQLVADNVLGEWTDPDESSRSGCYSVVANLTHDSPPSQPLCWWGNNYERIQNYYVESFSVTGGSYSLNHGRAHYENWGAPEHRMTIAVNPSYTGRYNIQLVYGNGSGGFDTGVTAAVKRIQVQDSNGVEVVSGSVMMPQLGSWERWGDSSFLSVHLQAGESYVVEITDGWNMSYLEHYRTYNSTGGGSEPYNYVNIASLKLLFME